MIKCAIIGGGLAGITSAVYLSRAGIQVSLFEASPKCGGRTYSFVDEVSGDIIDNGQHIMMGCYYYTLEFLKIIKSVNNLSFQRKLDIPFVDKSLGLVPLSAISTIYPLNLLIGLLNFIAIPLNDRLKIIKTIIKILLTKSEKFTKYSVKEWLEKEGQSKQAIKAFWEILVVSALNTKFEDASAGMFIEILKQIFLNGNKAATILLPDKGLSQVFVDNAISFIQQNNGEVFLSKPVESIIIENNIAIGIKLKDKTVNKFDFIISAVPYYGLERLLDVNSIGITKDIFQYSPILSAHIWLKENPFDKKFYGFIDSPVHWIFNKGNHITIVISNAVELIVKGKEEIIEIIINEIEKYFPKFNRSYILRDIIIKEKRATFISNKNILNERPGVTTQIKNLYLSGDWINTGLPATIEGAVKSGKMASLCLLSALNK